MTCTLWEEALQHLLTFLLGVVKKQDDIAYNSQKHPSFVQAEAYSANMPNTAVQVVAEIDMNVLKHRNPNHELLRQARLMLSIAAGCACCQDTCIRWLLGK